LSKVFSSIGKVFKKVLKVAVKVAPFALAAAAVVFTGGAALGILPTFSAAVGGVVSSLGLSAGVAGALTGAVTSAGFGAALGFVTGGKKGLQKGALMGALTGGVLGMVNPSTFGIVQGANGSTTTMNALTHGGNAFGSGAATTTAAKTAGGLYEAMPKGIAPAGNVPLNALDTQPLAHMDGGLTAPNVSFAGGGAPITAPAVNAAPVASMAPSPAGGIAPLSQSAGNFAPPSLPNVDFTQFANSTGPSATSATAFDALQHTTGGVGGIPASGGAGNILSNLTSGNGASLLGSVLQSLGTSNSKVSAKDLQKQVDAEMQLKQRLGQLAFGGVYSNNPNAFGTPGSYALPQPRYYYDQNTKTVIDRQAGGA
jgi:hypothetical protein